MRPGGRYLGGVIVGALVAFPAATVDPSETGQAQLPLIDLQGLVLHHPASVPDAHHCVCIPQPTTTPANREIEIETDREREREGEGDRKRERKRRERDRHVNESDSSVLKT